MAAHIYDDPKQPLDDDVSLEAGDILIPASVAIRAFNEATGAKCITLDDTMIYLAEHPEALALLEAGPTKGVQ